ncbi:MAG: hypothetical protein RLZZ169_187 [Pseudomonadota bacterium]|jgi:iron complex outermembrane receptor protein
MKNRSIHSLTLSLLALGIEQALGQTAANNDIYELVTTALHTRSAETALPVTIMTGDALHRAVRATLGDTLATQPGINSASFGPAVGQAVIRGQQGRRVMNLTNSIPNADASGNSADHAQTVEPLLATSLEVLRGPSTLLYGGGAIGGVVNVIDRRFSSTLPEKPEFAIETRHDTALDLQSTVAMLDFSTGSLVWHLDGVRREWNDQEVPGLAIDPAYLEAEEEAHDHDEDEHHEEIENTLGYVANTGGTTTNLTGGVSWILDSGHVGFAYSLLDNQYGLPAGSHDHGHAEDGHSDVDHAEEHGDEGFVSIDMERQRYDVDGEWRSLTPWLENLSYKASYIDYQHAELEDATVVGTQFDNQSWQHRLQLTHAEFNGWHGALGLQHSSEEFGAVGEESFIPVSDIDATGIFVVEDFHAGPVTYELGARLNRDEYAPRNSSAPGRSFTTGNLSGSALWQIDEPLTAGISVSHSERAPSVEELYSNHGLQDTDDCVIHFATGACEIGHVDLDEERSLNVDLTLAWNYAAFDATVTLFNNDFSDYIAQISTGDMAGDLPVREYQQEDAVFRGVEMDVNWQLNERVGMRLFGDVTRGSLDDSGAVPRMPPRRVGFEVSVAEGPWNVHASVMMADRQDRAGRNELPTDSWTRLDLGADYKVNLRSDGELLIFARGRNLGDDTIRLSTSFLRSFAPEMGRSLETGLRYRF